MGRRFRISDIDWFLLGLALAIAAIGVVEIYSTTLHSPLAGQYKKQIYWIVLSCVLALVASRLDYHMVLEQTPWLYGVSVLLLAGLLVAGHSIAGTRRWLQFGPMSFQVSEIVKLIIILVVAAYFADRRTKAVTWGDLVKLGIVAGIPAVLVALEPDLGTALTFIPIVAAGVLFAGIRCAAHRRFVPGRNPRVTRGLAFPQTLPAREIDDLRAPYTEHSKLQLPSYSNQDCHRLGRLLGKGFGQWHAESAGIYPCIPR